MTRRYLQGSPAVLPVTFLDSNGNPASPQGAPTVAVTRDDGTVLVPAGTAATRVDTGVYSYTLSPAQTAVLDELTVAWTATFGGVARTLKDKAEIVGGFLFTIAQARGPRGGMDGETTEDIAEARTFAEQELERAIGYALVPRYERERLFSDGGWMKGLRWPYVRTVRSVSVQGVAWTQAEIDQINLFGGFVTWPYRRMWGQVDVAYEHGLDQPPLGATQAALAIAADYLGAGAGSIDPRAESIVTADGTLRLRTGDRFNVANVDAWVQANRLPSIA